MNGRHGKQAGQRGPKNFDEEGTTLEMHQHMIYTVA